MAVELTSFSKWNPFEHRSMGLLMGSTVSASKCTKHLSSSKSQSSVFLTETTFYSGSRDETVRVRVQYQQQHFLCADHSNYRCPSIPTSNFLPTLAAPSASGPSIPAPHAKEPKGLSTYLMAVFSFQDNPSRRAFGNHMEHVYSTEEFSAWDCTLYDVELEADIEQGKSHQCSRILVFFISTNQN